MWRDGEGFENVEATWCVERKRYEVREMGWFSEDGDWWKTKTGQPAGGPEFEDAQIVLIGGPRDGTTVV